MFNQFHFDVLPIHSPLEPFESLTGYCTRIGQKNLIKSVSGIAFLLFPDSLPRLIQNLYDLPPISVSTMAKATNQTEERILESTFYYLAQNFERSTHPQPLGRFLNGTVAQFLRFCPICVKEKHYYSLLWRFNHIAGCKEHGCRLQECCPNCGCKIPIFHPPFMISSCPICGSNISDGQVDFLTEEDANLNKSLIEDIKLFLSPFSHPSKLPIPKILRLVRLYSNIQSSSIAKFLDVPEESICKFENLKEGGLKFSNCLSYLKALGFPFHKMIKLPFIKQNEENSIFIPVSGSKKKERTIPFHLKKKKNRQRNNQEIIEDLILKNSKPKFYKQNRI